MRRTLAAAAAGLLLTAATPAVAQAGTAGPTCPPPSVATRTTGTVQPVSATRLRVRGHTDYWRAGAGWRPLGPTTYRIVVQKQQGSRWTPVVKVAPDRLTQVNGSAGVYRLTYARTCAQRYAGSSSLIVRVPVPKRTAPKPAVRKPSSSTYFANCAAARAAGAAPLHRGDPGYRAGLDRDGDGIACE